MKRIILLLSFLFVSLIGYTQNQDCVTASQICSNANVAAVNKGKGSVTDLNATNDGCLLTNENQSSWFKLKVFAGGTLTFTINPNANADDYDFAVWGPVAACPPSGAPTRCSYACHGNVIRCGLGSAGANTGLRTTSVDVSEGTSGDGFVKELTVTAGQTYLLLVDNFTSSNNGFTLNFGGTATLGCAVLPVDIISFAGKKIENYIRVQWYTAVEDNLDKFVLERYSDSGWIPTTEIKPKGNNSFYSYQDDSATKGTNIYRLKSIDMDGSYKYYNRILTVDYDQKGQLYVTQDTQGRYIEMDTRDYPSDPINISIYDMLGKEVYKATLQEDKKVDISGLSPGTYTLVASEQSFLITKR